MEVNRMLLRTMLVFIAQMGHFYCKGFENSTNNIEPKLRQELVVDLQSAVNGSQGIIEVLSARYPGLLGIAARLAKATGNAKRFNESDVCKHVKKLLAETQNFCGSLDDAMSPCHLSKSTRIQLLANMLRLCSSLEKNMTSQTMFIPASRRTLHVTEYLLLAIKVLARAAMIGYQRSCIRRGGSLDDNELMCVTSTMARNASNYKYGLHTAQSHNDSLSIVSLTGNVVSITCLVFLLITYVVLDKCQTVPGKSTICLSLALIGTNSSQILVSYLSDERIACIALGILLHWLFLCAFLWMSALAYDYFTTFHRLQVVSSAAKEVRFRVYCLVAFGIPTVAVVVCLALDIPEKRVTKYGVHGMCFVVGFWTNLFAFVIPIALLLSVNISLLCYTVHDIRILRRSTNHLTGSNRKETLLSLLAMKIAVLVGVAWIMAFIDGFVSSIFVKYVYTVIVTFQGLFLYLAFGYFTLMLKVIVGAVISVQSSPERATTKDSRL